MAFRRCTHSCAMPTLPAAWSITGRATCERPGRSLPVGEPLRPLPGFWREVARRAFPEPPRTALVRYLHRGTWTDAPPSVCAGEGPLLAVILPTLARGEGCEEPAACLRRL